MTIEVRRAVAGDAAELTRLRAEMFAALDGEPEPLARERQWYQDAITVLTKELADPDSTIVAFVVDDPDTRDRLASCAIGTIDHRLPGRHNPSGYAGFVMSVCTDPALRRRGYSRACVSALLDWFATRGIGQVNLFASPDGQPLYTQLGFAPTFGTSMRLRMPAAG